MTKQMQKEKEKLSNNLEDYLEAISSLSDKDGNVRTTDIAEAMKVKKPSVTAALNSLSEKGLVEYEKYRPISLTKEGKQIAKQVRQKHETMSSFFTDVLGVDKADAEETACQMEHSLKDSILKKMMAFVKGFSECSSCTAKNKSNGACACAGACPKILPLSRLKKSEEGIVVCLNNGSEDMSHYAGMGLTLGCKVKILRSAPLGDPVVIKVRGTEISMRKRELENIRVRVI